ncbi:MAG: hypothetical protein RIR66_1145 [Actinomycetota bacterium]|jgi:hypothetical protein
MSIFKKKGSEFSDHLITGERVMAAAPHSGGKVVATNFALLSFDNHENLRIPWGLTLSAKWDEPVLIVISQDELTGPAKTRAWQLEEPGLIPDTVRERITTAQVFDQIKDLPQVGKVRFLARKNGQEISWATLPESEISPSSQTHIENELIQLRQTLGI